MPAMRRLVLNGFFLVALACTAIGLVEAGFIAYDWWSGGSMSSLRAPDLGRGVRSWTVHHAMRPGYEDSAVTLNSFGLRSPEVDVPKPTGTHRILLLGDSFTFGFKAADEDVFARRVEANLRQALGTDAVEVVNAGVLSYCPLLEYLQYRHHLHALEPDLVILNFDMSDVQDHLEYSRDLVRAADGTPLFVTEPSLGRQVPSRVPGLLSWQWVATKARAAINRFESASTGVPFTRDLDRYLWTFDEGPPMDREALEAMASIGDLKRLLDRDGVPLVLATYPQPWQVAGDATPGGTIRAQYGIGANTVHLNDRPFRLLEQFAAGQAIPFVNATMKFREAPEPAGLFLVDDFHFSPRGNDVYAGVLTAHVLERVRSGEIR